VHDIQLEAIGSLGTVPVYGEDGRSKSVAMEKKAACC
jgi:hypothetical protein